MGSKADCKTCYRCLLMSYSWYAHVGSHRIPLLLNDPFLDTVRIGAHGSHNPRPYEQGSAGDIDVAQVHVGLDSCAKECGGCYGS